MATNSLGFLRSILNGVAVTIRCPLPMGRYRPSLEWPRRLIFVGSVLMNLVQSVESGMTATAVCNPPGSRSLRAFNRRRPWTVASIIARVNASLLSICHQWLCRPPSLHLVRALIRTMRAHEGLPVRFPTTLTEMLDQPKASGIVIRAGNYRRVLSQKSAWLQRFAASSAR